MSNSFFENFTHWQLYIHYVLLTMGLFIWHGLNYTKVLEMSGNYFEMFMWYLIGFFIIDSFIHGLFWVLPEPLQWRD